MTRKIASILKIFFIMIIVAWMLMVIIDYYRAKQMKHPLVCFSEKTEIISNGNYYECISFAYKYYQYEKENKTNDYGFLLVFSKNPVKEMYDEK